jgi:gliding motility-associated-like protein
VTSSYNLLVTDANGCTTSQSVTITVNTIGASNTWAYTSCGGNQPRATVTLIPTSNVSTPVYSYAWSDGGTVQNPTSLTTGTYIVTVTETSSGCKTTNNVFVSPLTALSASLLTTVPVNCNSTNSGSIDIQTTGGQGAYTYIWSNSKTTEDITNLAVGTYKVSVTDQIGCTAMLSAYVDQPTAMSAVINQISVLGCGTGYASQLEVTQTGGTAPYTYTWSNAQTSKIATVYSSDLYKVTITDFNGCVIASGISVTANPALDIELTATDETCFNYKNGILSSQITGGVQNTNIPYAYTWSNGLQVPSMSGLEPNTYTLTVTQGASCSATLAATVGAATSFTVAISPSTYNLCRGASVVLVGSNSTGQYKWTSDVNTQVVNTSSNQLSVNVPAIYTATYTSSLGCTATAVATVTDVAPSISTPLVKNTSCGQLTDGFIVPNVVGAAPLNYLWSNTQTTANISGLAAGVYNLTVVNAAGCANTFAYTITDNPAVTLALTSTDITCFGANDGLVNASVSGGSGTYFYNWSNASSTTNLSALSANSYTLTVTDANGCSATASKTILEPSRLGVTLTANTDVCLGSSAFVNAAVSGGVGGNTFSWVANNVGLATTNNFVSQNISLNTKFKVTVTNTNGCKATDSIQTYLIEFASAPVTQYNSCQGQTYGSINPNITVSNASTRLRYTWSNGMTTSVLTSVPTGTYGLVVLDSLTGCSANFSINLQATSPLQALSGIVKNITCFGGSDGKLSVIASGGLSPYSYIWSTGATADSIVNLRKGNYSVTVIDVVGCKAISYFSIIEPSPVNTYANSIIASGCLGYSQGRVVLSTTGGTAPYAYVWDNGSTSNTVSALPEGIINVTVTDVYSCSVALAVNVPRLPMPLVQASSAYNYVCSNSVVDVIANASGGTLPYAFRWNNANTAQNIRAFISTDSLFKVTLTDANGCTSTSSYRVGLYNTEPAVAGPDINLCTGVLLNLTTPVNQNIVSFNWVTPVGSVIAGRSINVQNPVVGEYILNTRDVNGCTDADTMRFTMTNVPTMVDVQAQNSICYNSTLQLSATAYPTLNYVWFTPNANGGRTTVNTANQAFLDYPNIKVSGFYGVQLDLGACGILTDSVFVRVNRLTAPTITGSASACSRDTLILRASGPNGFYTWIFPDNSTNIGSGFMLPNLKQSDQGIYRVFYSSAVGSLTCQSDTARITVTISPALDTTGVAARMVSLVCSGDPLSLTATPPPNGSGNYAYHWVFPSGNEAFTRTTTINNPIDGRYYLYVKDLTTGCKVPVYPVSVSIAPRISVVPLSTTTPSVCSGDSIFLTALKIPGVQYVWTMPNGTKDTTLSSKYTINPASPANSGTYKVFVQAGTCLSNESEVIARVNPLPNIKISKDTMIGEVGIPMTIFATGGFQYLWSPRTYLSNADVAGPRIVPEVVDSLWYYVKGFDQNRCHSYDSVYVIFRAPPPGRANLVINDILTPNNDDVNDTWNIKNIENLLDYTLRIYDRRGLIIYETNRYDNTKGWDATFEGNPLPEGTYWYIIHTPAKDFKGPITIIR